MDHRGEKDSDKNGERDGKTNHGWDLTPCGKETGRFSIGSRVGAPHPDARSLLQSARPFQAALKAHGASRVSPDRVPFAARGSSGQACFG